MDQIILLRYSNTQWVGNGFLVKSHVKSVEKEGLMTNLRTCSGNLNYDEFKQTQAIFNKNIFLGYQRSSHHAGSLGFPL